MTAPIDIYVANADGTGQRQLTASGGMNLMPAWSPDSRQIAFTSTRDGHGEVYIVNADGSGQRRVTRGTDDSLTPAWKP